MNEVREDLVSMPEVAKILGVSRQRVHQLAQKYEDFPEPEAELAVGRIWKRAVILEWAAKHPRKPGRPTKN